MKNQNEFKLSTLRQFGSENLSFTATIYSDNQTLSEQEIKDQVAQINLTITEAFKAVQEREISEMQLLADASERRAVEVKKRDDALRAEMKVKEEAQRTLKEAQKLSDKLSKK